MLQTVHSKEAGFFSNSHISMDMEELRDILEDTLNFKVGIRYKAIFRGKQAQKLEGERPIQTLHIEIEMKNFKWNFNQLVARYSRITSSFLDGRKMRFFAYPNLVKSDLAWGALEKVYKRQKFFSEAIIQDYTSSFLHVDAVLSGLSLPTMRNMLLSIKSKIFPNMSLFYSMNRT